MTTEAVSAATGQGAWPQLRRLWRVARVLAHILLGFVLALVFGAFWAPYRPVVRRIARWWLQHLLGILNVQVTVQGAPPVAGHFLVANHVSWLDIPVLAAQTDVYFLSKAEVRNWPLIGHLAAAAGTLFIRRGSGESRQKAEEIAGHLRNGHNILVFPEGTTTDGRSVRRFFRQLFTAPLLAQAPVQPVALRYRDRHGEPDRGIAFINDDAFHTHLWAMLLRDDVPVTVTFGEPVIATDETPEMLSQQCHRTVLQAVTGH
ncbi:1-acyl-sn-glycerol-3-phosphate acyltransferase [Isoalcanivorax pacificus W11-5]|uniref:1-acyl-sn-glycerol-3-phosphate acyltransferase n=1 Tax=Isoalcanivorax pacificus W11-5 TaxID=391936 RepID=A0A0B4XLK3_9GAMM|nr:lysophospholipid acyltransferase family protein [Isoalcanivorax pacificus]AJD47570.1 1-acyl-sn-glycerol-3-phosphate acyltransferase [Isoalcanivorax pacificus W11-5]